MLEDFPDLFARLFSDLIENKFVFVLFGFFALSIVWPVVRKNFDKVVKREYGHVVAVDISVTRRPLSSRNSEPMHTRMLVRMGSGEELLTRWDDSTGRLRNGIRKQVFQGNWINLYAPKINVPPEQQEAAIEQMKAKFYRFELPQPTSVVVLRRKSGRFDLEF